MEKLQQTQEQVNQRIADTNEKLIALIVRMAATRQEKAALLARNRESQEMENKVASQQRKIAALPQKVSLDSASQRTQLQAAFVASMDDFIGVIDQSGSLLQLVAKTK